MYPFHPRCGERVLVQRRFAYRGVDLVVIPQPDGSIACIPEWMTHERAARFKLAAVPQFSLENLSMLRAGCVSSTAPRCCSAWSRPQ
jgi:hypothetical protein